MDYMDVLEKVSLFDGIDGDLNAILGCMSPDIRNYPKDGIIILTGDCIDSVGIILKGGVKIIQEDLDGNINIMTELSVSDIFGEAFVCAGYSKSMVTVQATKDSVIMFLNYKKVITTCSSACSFHAKLIANMLKIIATKNIMMSQKIELMGKRSTREKLLSYFKTQVNLSRSRKFTIPYNRMELAEFLSVDRSAMSRELSKMRDEGILDYYKNSFELY